MDKQGRLTKWDEWRLGEVYEWVKSGMVLKSYELVEINQKEGYVKLRHSTGDVLPPYYCWTRRFRPAEAVENRPSGSAGKEEQCVCVQQGDGDDTVCNCIQPGGLHLLCTRPDGHRGDHVACGTTRHGLARWTNEADGAYEPVGSSGQVGPVCPACSRRSERKEAQ